MRRAESDERPPELEVARSGDEAVVILRSNFEQVARDEKSAAWAWEERTCRVPWSDGLAEAVGANPQAWADFADARERAQQAAAEHARAVRAAAEALPGWQGVTDSALAELGDMAAAGADSASEAAARLDVLEGAVAELGDLMGGGEQRG